jgi:hypothetical protein
MSSSSTQSFFSAVHLKYLAAGDKASADHLISFAFWPVGLGAPIWKSAICSSVQMLSMPRFDLGFSLAWSCGALKGDRPTSGSACPGKEAAHR